MRKKHSLEKIKKIEKNGEIIFKGTPVSRGIGIGNILCLYGAKRQYFKATLRNQIDKEIRRFRASVRLAKRQIKKISKDKDLINQNQTSIFQTHLLLLEDNSLLTKIENKILKDKVNAEWAVKKVTDEYISKYKAIPDKHLRERYIDIEDIAERLLVALGGHTKPDLALAENSVIIAKELKPSTLIELSENNPAGIVTENGGWTSHTFILARELELPAVTGMKGILRKVTTGQKIVVDGYNGKIILEPKNATLTKIIKEKDKNAQTTILNISRSQETLTTLDHVKINVRVNLDRPTGYTEARNLGAKGIGLYRSEFLFNQNKGFPNEKEQISSYSKIAKLVGEDGVIIRTFDLNLDQFADDNYEKTNNSALGLRGIRWALRHEKDFRIQLRALLMASYKKNLDIVLPMVSDVAEIIRVKQILKQEKNKLKKKGIKYGDPKLGAMIEVPSAVFCIEEILEQVDFVNLGTNDLVQYLLAVDRDNDSVSDWFRTLHPAVLKSIEKVSKAANRQHKPMIVCGEMAGTPIYIVILIGLGIIDFSMNLNSIPRVHNLISNIAFEEARNLVDDLKKCKTSDEMEQFVRTSFQEHWTHLFDENSLPPLRKKNYKGFA